MKFRISEELQRSLSQAEPWDVLDDEDVRHLEVTLDDYSVARAVSEHLGFGPWADWDSPFYGVLLNIAKALEEPLKQHRAPNEDWSRDLLGPMMANWSVPQCIEVLRSINAEREEVGPVRVDRLAGALRTLAFNTVHEALLALIARWRTRGDFDIDLELEQRRAEARRQERRDRARDPRYTPPGRT